MVKPQSRRPKLIPQLLGAWTIAVMVFLYLPIVLLVAWSFNNDSTGFTWGGFTLKWYGAIWHDEPLMSAVENSLLIATATTIISVIMGTASAWLLHRFRFPARGTFSALAYIPMIIPEIIMGVSLMLLFHAVGIGLGFFTVVVAHVTFCFPFVMAAVQARLSGLDPSLEEAAMDLGATPMQAFFKVTLPYLMPGVIAGALLAFTLSLDEFIVTFFTCSAESTTLPVLIYTTIKVGLKPTLNAVSTLFIVATALLVLAGDASRRRG